MFPFVRMIKDIVLARNLPPLADFSEIHESTHICWPWDIDFFGEMNNGRVLTIYDLGRFASAQRGGLIKALYVNKWGLAMAGAMVRYRRRLTALLRRWAITLLVHRCPNGCRRGQQPKTNAHGRQCQKLPETFPCVHVIAPSINVSTPNKGSGACRTYHLKSGFGVGTSLIGPASLIIPF